MESCDVEGRAELVVASPRQLRKKDVGSRARERGRAASKASLTVDCAIAESSVHFGATYL